MISWKNYGARLGSNSSRMNWYTPEKVIKAVYALVARVKRAWWYPWIRSLIPKIFGFWLPILLSISAILGIGQLASSRLMLDNQRTYEMYHPVTESSGSDFIVVTLISPLHLGWSSSVKFWKAHFVSHWVGIVVELYSCPLST